MTLCASIGEAKAQLGQGGFDLLLCDYRVDDGTAVDLMRWMRAAGSTLSSICVSGSGEEAAELCMAAGFNGFLRKPVDMKALDVTLQRMGLGGPVVAAGK